ncbi:sensor histidine kinase [Parvularcula dongshanensis]|uniref:histidine kinase n=1 Tax=Parvularcula dongshanensis TaxID=1173995 RepID=A0A840I327_9PROT|nr:ATP-binding protein [Parvularcula dongshanensis]MBB4659249.1 two-component sensor histidine kinase [Parvularcula dongshanensis]
MTRRSGVFRWGFAVLAFGVSLAVRFVISEDLPPGFPYLTFFPAVILTAFVCGAGPGSVLALACGVAAWYFFVPEFSSFTLGAQGALALAFYVFIVAIDIVIIHAMKGALHRLDEERERTRTLAESRDTMFRELQHRVSNNIAVVSALLRLERGGVEDPTARRILDEAATKLSLVAKINRRLHDPAGQSVPLDSFLHELCDEVIQTAGLNDAVRSEVDAAGVTLAPERSVPIVLILTELVANAVEHGFAGGRSGTIAVMVRRTDDRGLTVRVADDGEGLPDGFSLETARSLGLRLVRQLTQQLGGSLTMTSEGAGQGTVCCLVLPPRPEGA